MPVRVFHFMHHLAVHQQPTRRYFHRVARHAQHQRDAKLYRDDPEPHLPHLRRAVWNNLLALEAAGLAGGRLYPGSWSEWSANPARPVARGG